MEWIVGNIMRAARQAFLNAIVRHAGFEFPAFDEAVAPLLNTRNPDVAKGHFGDALWDSLRGWEGESGDRRGVRS
jgi:hypothetical protein